MGSTPIPSDSRFNSKLRTETVAGFSMRDRATKVDALGFNPYVEAVAAFLTHKDTEPPLTLSIEGEWGSGKSSFMYLLEEAIRNSYRSAGRSAKVVEFNAWRNDKEEALWAAFAVALIRSLAVQLPFLERMRCHLRLHLSRFDWKKGWFSVARFVILSAIMAYVAIACVMYLSKHPDNINPFSSRLSQPSPVDKTTSTAIAAKPAAEQPEKPEEALLKLLITGAGGAGYLLVMAMLLKKLADILGNPFDIDLKAASGSLGYDEKLSFIERVHADFANILKIYANNQTVYVFIDDLDRCQLPTAADLMEGINLLLSDECKMVYILGIDRDKIAAALAAKYEKLLPYLDRSREGTETWQRGMFFGYSFLEKFIQIPYQIPRPTDQNLLCLLNNAATGDKTEGSRPSTDNVDPGILFTTSVDSYLVREIVEMASPALNHNPRRLKQFLNCFRLGAITASRTGLFGEPRSSQFSRLTPEQLGKLVAISLRWPSLLIDASLDHTLLRRLEEFALKPLQAKYFVPATYTITETDTSTTEKPDEVTAYWQRNPRLLTLLRFEAEDLKQVSFSISDDYSLAKLDLERYLEISLPVTFTQEESSTSSKAPEGIPTPTRRSQTSSARAQSEEERPTSKRNSKSVYANSELSEAEPEALRPPVSRFFGSQDGESS